MELWHQALRSQRAPLWVQGLFNGVSISLSSSPARCLSPFKRVDLLMSTARQTRDAWPIAQCGEDNARFTLRRGDTEARKGPLSLSLFSLTRADDHDSALYVHLPNATNKGGMTDG